MNLNQLNMVHPIRFSRQPISSVLNQIAENVITENQNKQQESHMAISQKVQDIDKKEKVPEKKEDEFRPGFNKVAASAKDISDLTERAISDLRNGVESAAGNLEYYREKIKYLLSQKEDYQKRADGEFTEEDYKQIEFYKQSVSDSYDWESYQKEQAAKQVAVLDKELNMYYKGIGDITEAHLGMAGFSRISMLQYSNSDAIKDEFHKQFGDIEDSLTAEQLGLKGLETDSDSEEILKKLDAAIDALDTASRRLEERYQSYTGKTLEGYSGRKSNEELLQQIKEEPIYSLISDEIIVGDKAPAFQLYLGNYGGIANNLLDTRG